MGKFNLNDPVDFAKIVGEGAGKALLPFSGQGNSAWKLEESAYYHDPDNPVIFHVFKSAQDYDGALRQISDNGGRRKAKFEFPYLDGQMTEDLGKKPETFDLDILLYGNNYLKIFNRLLQELNDPAPGILIHPVRGNIECVCENYQILHESSSRKSVAVRLTMIENSFRGVAIKDQDDPTAPSAISKLVDSIKLIGDAITTIEAAQSVARTVKNAINQTLTEYQNRFGSTSANMNGTFNNGNNIPALLPVNEGGLQNDDGSIGSSFTTVVASPSDPFQNIPVEMENTALQTVLATEQLFKDIGSLRTEVSSIIDSISAINNGDGALEFFSTINDLRNTALDLQDAYDKGKQSSRVKLIEYVVPRVMSVREVAFLNGISIDSVSEIVLLNDELESSNLIPSGTKLRLAVTI